MTWVGGFKTGSDVRSCTMQNLDFGPKNGQPRYPEQDFDTTMTETYARNPPDSKEPNNFQESSMRREL
ncbi:hypothetical protein CEXT_597931 [Caerostris extrusa]|uniref:Uncharacterized protein n=1 Tax=Caerostris extrusa TaxID=172846 RepID=A0AAV4SU90_CAEEX|nr:hypothetical protein CEXT_597931 [Caerostris extrusa]